MGRAKTMFMKEATENKGGFHRSLGIPLDKKIPEKKIQKAEHSRNPKIKKQAVLAETLEKHRPHKPMKSTQGLMSKKLPKISKKTIFKGSSRSR